MRTILTEVVDQSRLHGIFERINGLGLELLSVEAWPKNNEQTGFASGDAALHQSPQPT